MESENINHDCAAREEKICTCALLFGLKFKHFLIISNYSNTTMENLIKYIKYMKYEI